MTGKHDEQFVATYTSDTKEAGVTYFLQYPKLNSSFIPSPFGQQSCVCTNIKLIENDTVTERELTIQVARNSLKISAQSWSNVHIGKKHYNIIAVHGWLDSSDTFAFVAPLIIKHFHNTDISVNITAYDQAGCGRSQHRTADALNTPLENALDLMEILNALSWKRCGVLAHSFGASVSLHALAAFPERFSFYMSIDAFAVFSQYHPSVELPYQLRHALTDRIEHNHNTIKNKEGLKKRLLLYKPDKINMEVIQRKSQDEIMEDAAQNLCKRYRIYGLTIEAARKFVGRMIDIPENKALTTWTYDARLYHHILPMPSEQDLHALIRNLSCPVLLIMAEKGYPFDRKKFEERVRVMKQESRVPFSEVHWLPEMRHHFHMSHPKETADLIIKFFYALEKIPRSKL